LITVFFSGCVFSAPSFQKSPDVLPLIAIVGMWEVQDAFALPGTVAKFNGDGSGSFELPKSGGVKNYDFHWSITKEKKPVLIIESQSEMPFGAFVFFGGKTQSHINIDGDTLTVQNLRVTMGEKMPPLVLRKIR